ncbi:threonine synthase [Rapidithrix thailandica]|uniref:Threonine synthase n=1 Tax=Rapidithrix thailandica TaxID=413964 RepID=A0AAW9SAE0_9BACT
MELYSTKHQVENVSLKEAIFKGLPADNGLYMPVEIPTLPPAFFDTIETRSFQEIALEVAKTLIGLEIPDNVLTEIVNDAINFDAPVKPVHDNIHVLELFHGPTLAFKDFGARFMSRLMSYFLQKDHQEINILVATSGDTGSAVAQGFLGVPNIHVYILYPKGKVSKIQEQQLTTNGQNITALEIEGTFDDCQRLVKEAFLDTQLNEKLNLTSANSINICRLIPQSFYYFYAYAQLKAKGKPVVVAVPSGNFGNLCGGLIAQKMGLPIRHFVAATNANDIVPAYLASGIFQAKPSVKTFSNAMDVGNPSNFPRMLALHDDAYEQVKANISGKAYTDEETVQTIQKIYQQTGYLLDPHGAVGYLGLKDYLTSLDEEVNGVFLATAHPAKFIDVVETAIENKVEIPELLAQVLNKPKEAIAMAPEFERLKSFLLNK